RHHAHRARIEVLDEATNGAALAGGVASLEENCHAPAVFLYPSLQLDELDLQRLEFVLILDRRLDLGNVDILGAQELDEVARRMQIRKILGTQIESGRGLVGELRV